MPRAPSYGQSRQSTNDQFLVLAMCSGLTPPIRARSPIPFPAPILGSPIKTSTLSDREGYPRHTAVGNPTFDSHTSVCLSALTHTTLYMYMLRHRYSPHDTQSPARHPAAVLVLQPKSIVAMVNPKYRTRLAFERAFCRQSRASHHLVSVH
jgi:hypothetical protein